MDLDDISSQFDIFPNLNPKKLPHMMPPMVRKMVAAQYEFFNVFSLFFDS